MKKKGLLIVRVNPITYPADKQEELRKKIVKQLKDGVLMIDKSCTIECYDYNAKSVEIKVINKDDELIAEKKDNQ